MSYSASEVSTFQSVYVITGGPKHIKIGISSDVERRVKGIQTGCPFRVGLAGSWRTPHARKVELRAHTTLAKYRTAGEWFNVPIGVACTVVESLVGAHPRSANKAPVPLQSIIFCGNCSHHAIVAASPKITATFRCSKCGHRDRVHVIDF